jgi:hypothetical protein
MKVLDSRTEIVAKIRLSAASKLGAPAADARGALRYRMHLDVGLRWEEREPQRAELIDLSPFGACLKGAPEEWVVGDVVRFTLDWKDMKLPLVGRVVWSEGASVGLTFSGDTGLRSPSQETLAELLDRFV